MYPPEEIREGTPFIEKNGGAEKLIYTTYYGALKKLPKDVAPVSISLYAPAWWSGFQYKKLAPKPHDFSVYKENGDVYGFVDAFRNNTLKGLTRREVIDELKQMVGPEYRDIALVCFEGPGKFCHRYIVSTWLEDGGFLCPEYNYNKGERANDSSNPS